MGAGMSGRAGATFRPSGRHRAGPIIRWRGCADLFGAANLVDVAGGGIRAHSGSCATAAPRLRLLRLISTPRCVLRHNEINCESERPSGALRTDAPYPPEGVLSAPLPSLR